MEEGSLLLAMSRDKVFNIVLVESHLQFECALNYVTETKSSIDLIIIRKNNVYANDLNLNKYISDNSRLINKVIYLTASPNNKKELIKGVLEIIALNFVYFIKARQVLIGDHRSKWMELIACITRGERFYLDDGLATISHYHDILSSDIKRKLITSFDLDSSANCLVYKLNKIKIEPFSLVENSIAIVGMPILEKETLSKDVYLEYLLEVSRKFDSFDIYYFPHRYESDLNLELYKKKFNFKIPEIECSIEDFYKKNKAPKCLVGLYSTALINIKEGVKGVNVYKKVINVNCFPESRRVEILRIYEYMSHAKIIDI
ncbi:hypothetical protein [Vibrio owensii]|uniref:hypothetical protein n=1 Tax=Vibrio owensii TaxID=696485 RepID=UPI0038CE553E